MITKHVPREKDTSNFRRLANYILDRKHDGEKVEWARVTNCISDDPRWAITEIETTQARNTRSKGDKTYHLVVSLAPGERPSAAQLRDIEDSLCAALGYADHQRLSAVHNDTDCVHIHVAINKVHPTTHWCVSPRRDYYLLDAACRQLEEKHGLYRTNRIGDKKRQAQRSEENTPPRQAEKARQRSRLTDMEEQTQQSAADTPGRQAEKARLRSRPGDMEAHAGEQSLLGWIRENAVETLQQLRLSTATWQEAHQTLAWVGLQIVPRGAGLALRDTTSGVAIPASQADRNLSFKALTERWGPYTSPGPEAERIVSEKRYQKGPIHRHRDSATLYTEFQRERQLELEARKAARSALEAELKREEYKILAWYTESRTRITTGRLERHERAAAYGSLATQRKADLAKHRQSARRRRAQIALDHPLKTWHEYLQRRAEQGDTSALEVLRARERRDRTLANALLCATSAAEARHIILEHLKPSVRKDGVVLYHLDDGSTVRDERRQVGVEHPSAGAVFLALILAQERFRRQPIVVEGTEEFKRQVAAMAAVRGIELQFADSSMEAARRAALEDQRSQTAPAALDAFVAQRNAAREKVPSILPHRAWTPEDHGSALYRGRRHLADGTEAVLLERNAELLVKLVSPAQAAKASQWQLGRSIDLDARGRFLHQPGQHRSR